MLSEPELVEPEAEGKAIRTPVCAQRPVKATVAAVVLGSTQAHVCIVAARAKRAKSVL